MKTQSISLLLSFIFGICSLTFGQVLADSIGEWKRLADYHLQQAKENDQKIKKARIEIRELKKEGLPIINQVYNFDPVSGNKPDIEKIKKLKTKEDKLIKEIEQKETQVPDSRPSIENYQKQAFYLQKILENTPSDSIKPDHYYQLGLAQYKSKQYVLADKNFELAFSLKLGWIKPMQYRMQCAYYIEQTNTGAKSWLIKNPAEVIIEYWGKRDAQSLEMEEKELLLVAYEVMAFYSFNSTGEAGNYHCEDAKPWIEKIYAIEPNYNRVSAIVSYCD